MLVRMVSMLSMLLNLYMINIYICIKHASRPSGYTKPILDMHVNHIGSTSRMRLEYIILGDWHDLCFTLCAFGSRYYMECSQYLYTLPYRVSICWNACIKIGQPPYVAYFNAF